VRPEKGFERIEAREQRNLCDGRGLGLKGFREPLKDL
jgi:hypothetical protein